MTAAPEPDPDATLRTRALAALREGRVTILHARFNGDVHTPATELVAAVRTSRPDRRTTYIIDHEGYGDWSCTCGLTAGCAHVAAVQLVTGHRTPARKATP